MHKFRHVIPAKAGIQFYFKRHIIAKAALSDDFDAVCNRTQKLPRKSFVEALLRMVG